MKIAGIVAEYNPFHHGHAYHILRTKELSNADYIITIISGNFVQRGLPALLDKYLRCEMALSQGADLVLELPVAYATASAETFAMGAVSLLDKLGAVDILCFGSECGELEKLSYLAGHLKEESPLFKEAIQKELKEGHPYPAARERAIASCKQIPGALSSFEEMTYPEIQAILNQPNNILALEYLKSLQRRKSPISPITVARESAGYHDTSIDVQFASASAIRTLYKEGTLEKLSSTVPNEVFAILEKEYNKRFPIYPNDFSICLYYRLLMEKERNIALHLYQDVSKEIGQRIYNELPYYTSYEAYALSIKTRQYTLTRIYRGLLHILLNIRAKDYQIYSAHDFIPYARILGFQKNASPLLSYIKKNTSIPLISKMANANKYLDDYGKKMLRQDILAANIYKKIQEEKFQVPLANEFTEKLRIF